MEAAEKSRSRVAAAAYTVAGIVAGYVQAFVVAPPVVPGTPSLRALDLFIVTLILILFFAFWILRGVRWLTRFLSVVSCVRAALHFLNFVWPTTLFWTVSFLEESMMLADGSRHVGYLCSGGFLLLATVCLARAGWPPATAPAAAAQAK